MIQWNQIQFVCDDDDNGGGAISAEDRRRFLLKMICIQLGSQDREIKPV